MSEMGNFARRVLAEHPELRPGDRCLVNPDGTVSRIDTPDLQRELDAANQRIKELEEQLADIHSDPTVMSAAESCCGKYKRELSARAEAAERKLAVARTAFVDITHEETLRQCKRIAFEEIARRMKIRLAYRKDRDLNYLPDWREIPEQYKQADSDGGKR